MKWHVEWISSIIYPLVSNVVFFDHRYAYMDYERMSNEGEKEFLHRLRLHVHVPTCMRGRKNKNDHSGTDSIDDWWVRRRWKCRKRPIYVYIVDKSSQIIAQRKIILSFFKAFFSFSLGKLQRGKLSCQVIFVKGIFSVIFSTIFSFSLKKIAKKKITLPIFRWEFCYFSREIATRKLFCQFTCAIFVKGIFLVIFSTIFSFKNLPPEKLFPHFSMWFFHYLKIVQRKII